MKGSKSESPGARSILFLGLDVGGTSLLAVKIPWVLYLKCVYFMVHILFLNTYFKSLGERI